MNITRICYLFLCFAICGCDQKENFKEQKTQTVLAEDHAPIDTVHGMKEIGYDVLGIDSDFKIKVHVDSMKFNFSHEDYVALPLELANQIRVILDEKELQIERDEAKFYIYKKIKIDNDLSLMLVTNGAKYGYNTIYASLVDENKIDVLSLIPISKVAGDVGDSNVVQSIVYNNQEKLIIGVYKRYQTDDFTMGRLDGVYKIHHDSLLLYQVTKTDIALLEAKSGI